MNNCNVTIGYYCPTSGGACVTGCGNGNIVRKIVRFFVCNFFRLNLVMIKTMLMVMAVPQIVR